MRFTHIYDTSLDIYHSSYLYKGTDLQKSSTFLGGEIRG